MKSTFRTTVAALALAFSAFVLTRNAPLSGLAARAGLVLLVIFVNAWIIAVAERAVQPRGGLRLVRFPLGPRLLTTTPSLAMQFIVFILLLGCVTMDWAVAGWAALIVATVSIHALRKAAWYVVPAAFVVNTLATMKEFHTLGDLVKDASGLMVSLVWLALQAFMVCSPLLRTDAGAPLSRRARVVALIAALPAYGAAFWLFSRPPLAGRQPDLTALMMVLLLGGFVQSLVLGLLEKLIALDERTSPRAPVPSAHGVGQALMPMLLPLLVLLALFVTPVPERALAGHAPDEWMGLLVLLLIVPAVPAAVLVSASLDRLDGRSSGFVGAMVGGGALFCWFVLGPVAMGALYGADGPAAQLGAAFPVVADAGGVPLVTTEAGLGALFTGAHFGGDVAIGGLPVADMLRAVTLMLLGAAALSARYMRHARPAQKPAGWLGHLLLLGLTAAGCWHFMPRIGPAGAPLAAACACIVLLTLDILHSEIRVKVPGSEDAPEDGIGATAPALTEPLYTDDRTHDITSVS